MATVLPPPSKRVRREAQLPKETNVVPTDIPAVQIQFRAADSGALLPGMHRVPGGSTAKQLELLLNTLLEKTDDPIPYSFTLAATGTPIASDIYTDLLHPRVAGTEDVLTLEYVPQAVFRVQCVTRCSATMQGHGGTVLALAFPPAPSATLVTASGDTTARTWDTFTGTPTGVIAKHTKWVLCVACSPDGKIVATGAMDGVVRLYDLAASRAVGGAMTGHSKWITSLAFEPLHLLTAGAAGRLASASKDGTVRIWDLASRTTAQVLSGHTACVTQVKWGGLGVIYTCSQDRTVKVWDARGDVITLIATLKAHAHWVNFAGLSTDFVLKTGAYDPFARKSNAEEKEVLTDEAQRVCARERFNAASTSHGVLTERVVTASDDQTMYLWNLFPDGRVTSTLNANPVARMMGHQKPINHVAFSADGRLLASCGFDNAVKLWNGATGAFLATLRGHVAPVYMCAWSADSRLLASCSKDCTVKIWDVAKAKLHMDMPGHKDEVYTVDWSADGKVLASGGRDKTVKLWRH
ncbi:WD40-repeat-containing domain protein [Limtongia smithiae]|uniref:WD40-repeat-containing domain protein n=1 Tax=Limtongia smithiae TaxID=1125753 RepID=UPI0034CE1BB4